MIPTFIDWMGVYFPEWKFSLSEKGLIPEWSKNGKRDDKIISDLFALYSFEIKAGYIKETDDEGFVTIDNVTHLNRM